jgi:mitochondrial import receptor subunit TOM40
MSAHAAFPNDKPHVHAEPPSWLGSLGGLFEPVAAPIAGTFERFHNWKEYMGLSQPGTVENLTRDVTSESARRRWRRASGLWDGQAIGDGAPSDPGDDQAPLPRLPARVIRRGLALALRTS